MTDSLASDQPLPERPTLNPAVPVLELPGDVVQLGWSRRDRVAGVVAELARECLALLGAQRPLADYSSQQLQVLRLIADAGLLLSAQAPADWAKCGPEEVQRMRALAAGLQRHDAGRLLQHRRAAAVAVVAPPGWQALDRALAGLSIGAAPTADTATAVVLVGRAPFNSVSALMRRGIPHLAVVARTASVRVGPLVVPSQTPCLQCLHLARNDRDRYHRHVASGLERWQGPPRDPVLVQQAALLAARLIARHLDDACTGRTAADPPDASGRYWTVAADKPQIEETPVARHPLCDCWWEPLAASG